MAERNFYTMLITAYLQNESPDAQRQSNQNNKTNYLKGILP